MLKLGVEYSNDPDNFFVRYNAPARNCYDLRTEVNNDALKLREAYGSAYVFFSSGIDSQIIVRCFQDMNVDAEYIFLHAEGLNDVELNRAYQCEKFYGIRLRVIRFNLESFKEEWIQKDKAYVVPGVKPSRMIFNLYDEACKQLDKNIPIINQGAVEPCFIAPYDPTIYCNYFESSQERFKVIEQHGKQVYDFPFSPEAVSSYYTDIGTQTFIRSLKYYHDFNLLGPDQKPLRDDRYWNTFGKTMVKGKYFKDDIIYYGKLTGYENYPDWVVWPEYLKKARVTVRYWDLFEFLTTQRNTYKDYNE